MKKYIFAMFMMIQTLYGFWPFDLFRQPQQTLPPYVMEHPMMNETSVYGVGSGKSFLEAKSKALNDIATQLQSDVRSITSVHKESTSASTSTDQQITVITKRKIENFSILDESHADTQTYLLIEYKRIRKE